MDYFSEEDIMISNPEHSEKRDFIRMKVETSVQFTIGDNETIYHGRTRNLSGNGLLFETSQKLDIGEQLRIIIESQVGEMTALQADAQVARSTYISDQSYLVAVQITNIS